MDTRFTKHGLLNKISHNVTIMPRLIHSIELVNNVLSDLEKARLEIKKQNMESLKHNDKTIDYSNIELEKKIFFSIDVLHKTQKRLKCISNIVSIPFILSSTIMLIRTASSLLFDTIPLYSQRLCELSTFLSSIVIDSATITQARFDFKQLNLESSTLLDEAKLMADSKINKQYANLDSKIAQLT